VIGKDDYLGYAQVDLLQAIQENGKEMELVLGGIAFAFHCYNLYE
jgi:hypothetical protein